MGPEGGSVERQELIATIKENSVEPSLRSPPHAKPQNVIGFGIHSLKIVYTLQNVFIKSQLNVVAREYMDGWKKSNNTSLYIRRSSPVIYLS